MHLQRNRAALFLSTRWNEREYFGCLFFDDERSSKQVFDTLTHIGSRISDIGRLNIPVNARLPITFTKYMAAAAANFLASALSGTV
jgi:hypothetical protein